MATRGLEMSRREGLGWIAGDVEAIEPKGSGAEGPAHGLEHADVLRPHPFLAGIPTGDKRAARLFRALVPSRRRQPGDVVAETEYGGAVTAMVGRDNIAGTQFHPEKSQSSGLGLIANFLRWKP